MAMLSPALSAVAAMAAPHLSLIVLLVKATIILVAALGTTMAMQRASAGARHLVWLVALGTLLIMPALTAWGPLPVRVLPAAAERAPVVTPASISTDFAPPSIADAAPPASVPAISGTTSAPAPSLATRLYASFAGLSGLALAVLVWGVVMFAIGCSLVWSAFVVRRIVAHARPLDSSEWLAPLWEVSDRFGLEDAPRLLRSDEAKMPFACGLLTPTIVLPAECDGWSLDRRRAVLLHELAHVRRRDLLGHTLGRLVCAVYWFHPLVWTAAKQLRSESERACDDLALSCGTRATDYAEHLLDIVTAVRRDATPSVALAMARRKEFEGRMLAILDPQLQRAAPSRRETASLIATLAVIAVVVGAAAPAPRDARAAVVPQSATRVASQAPATAARPSASESASEPSTTSPAYERDSRIHGIAQHVATASASAEASASAVASATATRTVTNEMKTTSRVLTETVGPTVNAIVAPTVSAVMRGLFQGTAGGSQKSDDRPILLAKVLRSDTSATLRRVAAWGLQEYAGSPVAAEALSNAVRHDANAAVREMAAWSLADGDQGSSVVLDALSAALRSDADVHVRATAAWALGNVGDHAATDALVAALNDASPDVRTRALWAIGNVGPKQAPRAVMTLLTDKDAHVRELAAWALYQIEDPAAAPALEAALRAETSKDLQLAYIRALAALGEKSVDAIRGLLESPDQRIRTMAVKALAGGHAAGPWPWPWPEPRPYP
jgi:beta-lactamase regulating signal transducer with metallopeptidase domain